MNLALDIFNYIFIAILIGVSATWIFLIKSMFITFQETPFLDKFKKKEHEKLKVSVILPARNEEKFIGNCLDSLLNQDYTNYEIIVIDDSSDDSTGAIIKKYSKEFPKLIYVDARHKPEGWIGKNWACMEGYKKATGDLLLFTDSDTKHASSVISLAVSHLLSLKLHYRLFPYFYTHGFLPYGLMIQQKTRDIFLEVFTLSKNQLMIQLEHMKV